MKAAEQYLHEMLFVFQVFPIGNFKFLGRKSDYANGFKYLCVVWQ